MSFHQLVRIVFQSTLPVWGATGIISVVDDILDISIHAPRVGSDDRFPNAFFMYSDFNPRSPCGERRPPAGWPPLRPPISIHAPRVGSDPASPGAGAVPAISIHAPRVGSDRWPRAGPSRTAYFNPRSPCGERPWLWHCVSCLAMISIHAPRVGSDGGIHAVSIYPKGISIHAPRVGSDSLGASPTGIAVFQSTLPVWGATVSPA